jgi:hypothetical protein
VLSNRLQLRAAFAGFACVVGLVAPVVAAPPAFCTEEGPRAVLVVDRENGSAPLRMCVGLPDDEVSGLRLIKLANAQYDLQYRLGHGGAAVCQLANVPAETPPNDCLRQGDPFWGYWRDGGGGWQWSGSGGAATEVEDGDVEGWSFGMGNDGGSHPKPPRTRASDVCRPVNDGGGAGSGPGGGSKRKDKKAAPRPERSDQGPDGGSPRGSGGGGGIPAPDGGADDDSPHSTPVPEDPGTEAGKRKKKAERPDEKDPSGSERRRLSVPDGDGEGGAPAPIDVASPTPDALPAGATSAEDEAGESGFPLMGLVALGAAAAMGTAAAVITTRRRRRRTR